MENGSGFGLRGSEGFTLIETVVAVALLVAMVAGLSGVWLLTMGAVRGARERTVALALARDKLEQLVGLTWGVQTIGGAEVLVADTTTDVSRSPATAGGAGTAASPVDALRTSHAGYADYLDGDGRWIGAGVRPPPGARYVRRWTIAQRGSGASGLLLFQVLVTTVAVAERLPPGMPGRSHPDVVWICGAKLRRWA